MTWVINPAVGCHYFPPGPQLPSQPLRGLLPILLLGKQRHDGCKQFAYDCYPTASRLRFEPTPFCVWVQHDNHSATEPPNHQQIISEMYRSIFCILQNSLLSYLAVTNFWKCCISKLLQTFILLISWRHEVSHDGVLLGVFLLTRRDGLRWACLVRGGGGHSDPISVPTDH